MDDSQADEEIVKRVVLGDIDSFRILIGRHQSYVKTIARRFLQSADIDDAAQEAFVDAYRNLKTFRHESSFKSWLTTIVIRRCYRTLKKSYRSNETQAPAGDAEHQSWLDAVSKNEAFRRYSEDENLKHAKNTLQWAMNQLSADDRMIVSLLHFEDRKVRDIAATLNWSEVQVKVRAHRARGRLKKILQKLINSTESEHE